MARVILDLPDKFDFHTEIIVHISEINHANHVGGDGIMLLLNEARIRFFGKYGYKELDIEGYGIVMNDTVIIYKSEAFQGDVLDVDIALTDFFRYGFDFIYLIKDKATRREVARAKTGIMFFDYDKREKAEIPAKFRTLFAEKEKDGSGRNPD
jgi:acyl-CoA thioester hydrolase